MALTGGEMKDRGKIWIDLDNSPHVPFFKPIMEELEKRGYSLLVTARDCFQVRGLADLHQIPCQIIGRHSGKNKVAKLSGLFLRALQLAPTVRRERPCLALSHVSRSQLILSNILRIPSVVIFDYEFIRILSLMQPGCAIVPEVIPDSAIHARIPTTRRYPGIKEDVYVPSFTPQPGILEELGVGENELVITVRPPATEAHYHAHLSDVLFDKAVELVARANNARMIMLPRNSRQGEDLRCKWPDFFSNGKIIVPTRVMDGLNLIWYSDLVISGGGTMNREAAALGVPVYSIFGGQTGAVDGYLAKCGRLKLLQTVDDVQSGLALVKWARPLKPECGARPALCKIVSAIESFAADHALPEQS
jgi:uncharacterized protein